MWRRAARTGQLDTKRADQALSDLAALPLVRAPHGPLISRIWELRANLSTYDAAYVVLAEAAEVVLLTADQWMARAPGARCEFEVVS